MCPGNENPTNNSPSQSSPRSASAPSASQPRTADGPHGSGSDSSGSPHVVAGQVGEAGDYDEVPVPIVVDNDSAIWHEDDTRDDDNASVFSDTDSAYESLAGSSRTGSITSSIYNYVYENGRRYHAYRSGQYVLPNDEAEQERLDLQHHIWRLLLHGGLYTAPLNIPAEESDAWGRPVGDFRILDLGTGTGIWAIDMAEEFPQASVFGIDLSPIQPDWVPPNCRFHVDDYEDDWTYREDEKFDYIHGRALSGTVSDWARFYRQVRTHLKPGGWCEMQEYDAWIFSDDDSFERAVWTKNWVEKLDEASQMYGKRLNVARFHKQWMIEAGFEDVQEKMFRIPIGPWAKDPHLKELGRYEQLHMQMSVASHTPALFSRVWHYTPQQCQVTIEGVKNEFRNPNLRLITQYRFIIGRSPGPP